MAAQSNDVSNIGRRIGRLLQQYQLRIAYAEYKSKLYEEEREKASASGQGYKTLQATLSQKVWKTYMENLVTKKSQLEAAVREALVCYNEKERKIWWLYFIKQKSSYEIEEIMKLNSRAVQRIVASMKSDMELKFEQKLPRIGEASAPKWSAQELACFLEEKPSDDYVAAIRDMLDYGIVDIDTLEFDETFQDYLKGKRPL